MKVELFDRYVHEVGRHLPRRMRADVAAELHSLLMDALQERIAGGEAEDGQAVVAQQVAILKEFGPPAKVAERYAPRQRYLIGPHVFGLYEIVVAAVLGAIAVSQLVLLALSAWSQGGTFGTLASLGAWLGGLLHVEVIGFASVTVTFAILERVLPASALGELDDEASWDPRSLPQIQDRARIEAGGLLVEIGFLVVALVVFNFFPALVGINFPGSVNGGPVRWISAPLLSPTFRTIYLPWLDALWIASIGLNLALLRRGRWERLTRLADCLLTAGGAAFVYWLLSGPSILTAEAIEIASLKQVVESILTPMVRIGLVAALVVAGVETVRKLYLVFATQSQAAPGQSS